MAKGVTLYWRIKDESGKWYFTKVKTMRGVVEQATKQSQEVMQLSNIFDEYLPKLIVRIETDEFVWEMWDL